MKNGVLNSYHIIKRNQLWHMVPSVSYREWNDMSEMEGAQDDDQQREPAGEHTGKSGQNLIYQIGGYSGY